MCVYRVTQYRTDACCIPRMRYVCMRAHSRRYVPRVPSLSRDNGAITCRATMLSNKTYIKTQQYSTAAPNNAASSNNEQRPGLLVPSDKKRSTFVVKGLRVRHFNSLACVFACFPVYLLSSHAYSLVYVCLCVCGSRRAGVCYVRTKLEPNIACVVCM